MQVRIEEGKKQIRQYGDALKEKYDNLRLKQYAVVSLGFERLWWQEVKEPLQNNCKKGNKSI